MLGTETYSNEKQLLYGIIMNRITNNTDITETSTLPRINFDPEPQRPDTR